MQTAVDVRRSGERFHTRTGWLDSRHSFSFARHWDPGNTHHGLLLVSNDDVVRAGTGFTTHPHRDMEIVTWVLDGRLEHLDTLGNHDEIYPGLAQRMSAGTGIWHSEMNPSAHDDVRFVQMWVLPDTEGIEPAYEQLDISDQLDRGGLVTVASGRGDDSAIRIRQAGAELAAGRVRPGEPVTLPDAPHVHVYVARGSLALEGGGRLDEGDAARLTMAGGLRATAGAAGAEVLVWATD
ncbi:MAG: pirin family protein [Acidimicrobiales bacterium]|nr:pirin family protein [Acidimicrobiales bacterium]